jgi:hypothetical protein
MKKEFTNFSIDSSADRFFPKVPLSGSNRIGKNPQISGLGIFLVAVNRGI